MSKSTLDPRLLVLTVIVVLLSWFGCADNTLVTELPADAALKGQSSERFTRTEEIRKRVDHDLLEREGVEGVGTRILPDGTTSIIVYTRSENVAAKADIPSVIDDIPVKTVVTGVFRARSDETSKARPAPIGFSVGHPDITAGTIGARVRDSAGNVYILSNNHVLANSNNASVGDATLQPGPIDGGTSVDQIGTLADFEPLDFSNDNQMDAAISIVNADDLNPSTPSDEGYGMPSSTITDAAIGQEVQKYGRTTGHTQGEISEVNVTVEVCYKCAGPFCFSCASSARFVGQIGISPGEFSAGGDSGSLIVTSEGNNPVGLLFAGSDTRTLANPISAVLDRFNVVIDDGSDDNGGDANTAPTASFSFEASDLTVNFTDSSTDSDGSIVGWSWEFGDGAASDSQNPSHTYGSEGSYSVLLTVTDDDGATDTASQIVSVSSEDTSDITLAASGYKVRGRHNIDLTWSGAASSQVDVVRNSSIVTTTANDGSYTDATDNRGGASYTYQVCEAETQSCSNEVTVTF